MKHKEAAAIVVCLTILTGCAKPVVPVEIPPEQTTQRIVAEIPATDPVTVVTPEIQPAPVPQTTQQDKEQTVPAESSAVEAATEPTEEQPTIPVTEPEREPAEEPGTTPTEPPTEPTFATTEPPEETVPDTTVPVETPSPATEETEAPTEAPEPVPEWMLRELEAWGRSYAVSAYGYEVDYSLGFHTVCGYYPGMSGNFNAEGYEALKALVKTNVDTTTRDLMGQSGPVWGYREDNGELWRTRINVTIEEDGSGSYTVWVFYG